MSSDKSPIRFPISCLKLSNLKIKEIGEKGGTIISCRQEFTKPVFWGSVRTLLAPGVARKQILDAVVNRRIFNFGY